MSVRTDIAAALTAALPTGYAVIDHDTDAVLTKVTVLVVPEKIERGATQGSRDHTVSLVILAPTQIEADGTLETALDEVLDAVDFWTFPAIWSAAQRATWDGTYACYLVTVQTTTQTA